MSVIAKSFLDQSFKVFTKGSPERIRELCLADSLPGNFDEVLDKYTECGYRVLALACKPMPNLSYLKSQKIAREEVECSLTFLGFLIM
jgi:cation-transporting ATPase 13A2